MKNLPIVVLLVVVIFEAHVSVRFLIIFKKIELIQSAIFLEII